MVGADQQHHPPGRDAVQLAVVNAPEDLLDAIGTEAEVEGGPVFGEELVPDRFTGGRKPLGGNAAEMVCDRVAEEDYLRMAGPGFERGVVTGLDSANYNSLVMPIKNTCEPVKWSSSLAD